MTDPERTVELRLRAAVESSPSGLLMVDPEGRVVLVNRQVEQLFGYSREELLGHSVEILVPGQFQGRHPDFRKAFHRTPVTRAMGAGRDLYGRRKDGTEVPVEIGLTPVETSEGLFVISSIVDISARKQAERDRDLLEEQLRQAQKLEALGRLAGGVAHDFNNILGAIVGYAEIVRDEAVSPAVVTDIEEVLRAAARGKELIERILRFSRRQTVAPSPLELGQVIREASRLLRATIPAGVDIRLALDTETPHVMADATSVHQMLMNLANNGAQAMPSGGVLEIGLDPFYVRDSFARANQGLSEGLHALLSVRDSGHGMDEVTRSRAFEPFFTTKAPGQGSGLGLSLVHGIVRDHGGAVWIDSEPGHGTVVNCLLPAVGSDLLDPVTPPAAAPRGGGERILLVDDEAALVAVGQRRLMSLGYEVTGVIGPHAALTAFREAHFDLVITDYSMPQMTGLDLARWLAEARAGVPVILVSGYTDAFSHEELASAGISRVLAKPATALALAEAVRDTLDRELGSDSAKSRTDP